MSLRLVSLFCYTEWSYAECHQCNSVFSVTKLNSFWLLDQDMMCFKDAMTHQMTLSISIKPLCWVMHLFLFYTEWCYVECPFAECYGILSMIELIVWQPRKADHDLLIKAWLGSPQSAFCEKNKHSFRLLDQGPML